MFGCLEVTIGWFGKERVDYITYDTNDIWRCYEIKVSKSDFHSKAHNTFIGHYNYYVMPRALYDEVKDEIPNYIGVWVDGNSCIKKAKKQEIKVDEQVLKSSMIRSLYREVNKYVRSKDVSLLESYKREVNRLNKNITSERKRYNELYEAVYEKYGREVMRNLL